MRSNSYVERTSSGMAVAAGNAGKINAFSIIPDGTNAGTVIFRNESSSGTILGRLRCPGNQSVHLPASIAFTNGLYVAITGTGITAGAHYSEV